MICSYDGGIHKERKNGLLFQTVEYRIVKCRIAAAEFCGTRFCPCLQYKIPV